MRLRSCFSRFVYQLRVASGYPYPDEKWSIDDDPRFPGKVWFVDP
jgi:hypothetical protein